jgi:hypothetical protein
MLTISGDDINAFDYISPTSPIQDNTIVITNIDIVPGGGRPIVPYLSVDKELAVPTPRSRNIPNLNDGQTCDFFQFVAVAGVAAIPPASDIGLKNQRRLNLGLANNAWYKGIDCDVKRSLT